MKSDNADKRLVADNSTTENKQIIDEVTDY